MDDQRFDAMTKALASSSSRQAVVRHIGVIFGGALGLRASGDISAQKGGGGGKPQGRCPDGFTNCRGRCVDLQGDRNHCGACATACPDATLCLGGTCQCPDPTEYYVGGACYALDTDPFNCGTVGTVCSGSTPYCAEGMCVECLGNDDCSEGSCQGNACLCIPLGGSGCTYDPANPYAYSPDCCLMGVYNNIGVHCSPSGVCGGPEAYCTNMFHCASYACDPADFCY